MRCIAILLLSIPCPLMAQIPVVIDVPPGVYIVRIEAKADGTSVVEQLNVYRLDGKTPENPPENPDTMTPIGKRVKVLVDAVADDPNTKQAFQMLYDRVSKEVGGGTMKPELANEALAFGSNRIVAESETAERWKPFREGISAVLIEQAVGGNYGTAKQISKVLVDIQSGIKQPKTELVPAESTKWQTFIDKIITLFRELE